MCQKYKTIINTENNHLRLQDKDYLINIVSRLLTNTDVNLYSSAKYTVNVIIKLNSDKLRL